jgi:hypothetical protein
VYAKLAPSFVESAQRLLTPGPHDALPGGFDASHRFETGTVRKSPPLGVDGGPLAQSDLLS